jgi:plastocyanin
MRSLNDIAHKLLAALLAGTMLYGSHAFAHGDEEHDSTVDTSNAEATNNATITITDGWVSEGPDAIKVKRGDQVRLVFTSNQPDELHLHGYDIAVQLEPNTPAVLEFTASYAGRFGYELHKAHREIGAIEVHP